MTKRKHTPLHDFLHPRVEGQIRDAMHSHPEWFNITSEKQKRTLVNSLAKRIVGEIAAAATVAAERAGAGLSCPGTTGSGGGFDLPSEGGEVAVNCLSSETPDSADARFRHRFEADKAEELTEEEWGQWVNRLPKDEFWAMMELGLSEAE